MGTSVYFEGTGLQPSYVLKLSAYPTALWYSQDEIPDGNTPCDISADYLENYLKWLEHMHFMLTHLTDDCFRHLIPTTSKTRSGLIEEIVEDIANVKNAMQWRTSCYELQKECHLSVG